MRPCLSKMRAFTAIVLALPTLAFAQTVGNTHVRGSFSVTTASDNLQITFDCTGTPTCSGQYLEVHREPRCSNTITVSDAITITGLDLSRSDGIQGTMTLARSDWSTDALPDGTCVIKPANGAQGPIGDTTVVYTGTWNLTTGTGSLAFNSPSGIPISAIIKADITPPPVFPMVVRAEIDANTATASADIQFRPQDVGTTGSVFVFALAPATQVKGAQSVEAMKVGFAKDAAKADTPIACVLAQLSASGRMVAVSSANLAAYLTGVLSAQGASVTILNGVPTGNVAGTTFFVGYGPNGATMINTGVNRSAVTVPGAVTCQPSAPQTGWWWNPLEDGRGFSLEVHGNNLFFAAFLYDVSGRSTWVVSSGPASLEGSYFTGDLYSAKNGQTLGGPYPGFPAINKEGTATLSFSDASHGTLVWPGGTVPIERFNIVPNGLNAAVLDNQPESGWWWNAQENGRDFFIEWQGSWVDMAGYMYDDTGNPVWYITVDQMKGATNQTYSNTWWSYAGGQTLTGPWRQNHQVSNNVAPVTVQFTGPTTALMTLPNGRTTALTRQRF